MGIERNIENRRARNRRNYHKTKEQNRIKNRRKNILWRKENKERLALYNKAYYADNKDKVLAVAKERRGTIKNKSRMQTLLIFTKEDKCALCPITINLEFHHWRYRVPVQRIDFSTLCKEHHAVMHHKGNMQLELSGQEETQ